jgi:hypothetical protein
LQSPLERAGFYLWRSEERFSAKDAVLLLFNRDHLVLACRNNRKMVDETITATA